MAFIPATPGIVGFGGGNKPAVFQAIAPQYQLINQQTDDDEPALFCHDIIGDVASYALSGVQVCTGCFPITLPDASIRDAQFSFTGVNGTGMANWDGVSKWIALAVGVGTLTIFSSADGSCSGGIIDTGSSNLDLSFECGGSNAFFAIRVQGSITLLSGNLVMVLFDQNTPSTSPVSNGLTIAFCGSGTGTTSVNAGYDGTLTIVIPP